jgi:outer membrane usher protein FimD/PapC
VLVSRFFELTPDLIRQPTATLHASTALPADVEVAIDGTTIYRARVGPGPITLNNLLMYGGTRNIRVTVTDVSGRREVFDQPFLFTDQVLAAGLHDYSYFVGRRSELGEDNGLRYREWAWQGFHRYGVTDALTLGAGGEGSREFANVGVGATLRSDALGLISTDVLTSLDRVKAQRAHGWALRYTYYLPNASLLLGWRQFGEGFRTFTTTPQSPFLRREARVGVAGRVLAFNLSADFLRSEDLLETRNTRLLRASTNVGRRVTLTGELQSSRVNGKPEWGANVFLRMELDSQQWVSATARAAGDARGLDVEAGRQIGQAEGFGYRVGMTSTVQQGATSALAFASGNWNLRPATLEFFGTSQVAGGRGYYAEAAVSGAVVGVDGAFGLTRRVDEGFVLARLGVPQPGVDILLNNQVQGATDAEGKLFIPQVGAYGRQDIALNDKQLGMQFNIAEKRRTISLPYRGATVVDFAARRSRALVGMAWQRAAGERRPLPSQNLQLKGPQGLVNVETSPGGDFYLEDAPPGRYAGRLALGGKDYSCAMDVPDFPEPVHELQEGLLCE